jgi:hypothetical protein
MSIFLRALIIAVNVIEATAILMVGARLATEAKHRYWDKRPEATPPSIEDQLDIAMSLQKLENDHD